MLNWDLRFFKDILMYVAQTSFRFLNMPFIVGVSLDIIYYWFLGCFIGFNCKYSKNIVRHVPFIMANLKSFWPITMLVIMWLMVFAVFPVIVLVYLTKISHYSGTLNLECFALFYFILLKIQNVYVEIS